MIPPARERVEWLDVFRGAAVLAMIETHVVNTFLAPEWRAAAWFGWLDWFNGLIAPAFLFIAGWVQGLGWSGAAGKPGAFARKTRRLLGIAALGYGLHFPWTELGRRRWAEALRVGTQVDVLPCLAGALLVGLGVQWLALRVGEKARTAIYRALLGALAAGVVAVAPAALAWQAGPVPVVALVNQTTGSLFPLLPWAAFVFAGALCGSWRERPAGALVAAGGVAKVLAWMLAGGRFSVASPAFFCERLAWVAALALLCQWICGVWRPGALRLAGRESLVMYAAHLLIIAWLASAGVPRGGWTRVAGIWLAVMAGTWLTALAWMRWQVWRATKTHPDGG